MQIVKILYNPEFSATTSTVNVDSEVFEKAGANLILHNDYYVYGTEIGQNLANDNNVKDFLNDEKNIDISMKFVDYLKNSTQLHEFKEIFYNNKKLSAVFNEYYKENYVSNQHGNPNKVIQSALVNTTGVTVQNSSFDQNNNVRLNQHSYVLDENSVDQNYFIKVFINQDRKLIDRSDYSEYFKDCYNNKYVYTKYSWINKVNATTVNGNLTYINNHSGPNFGTVDILNSNPFNNISPSLNVALVSGGRGSGNNGLPREFIFGTFSEFKTYFQYNPTEFTTQFPGFYITQNVILITNNLNINTGYNYNYNGYGSNQTTYQFSAKFKNNPMIKWDGTNDQIIPIRIELNNPAVSTIKYFIHAEPFSPATFGTDFFIDQTDPSLPYYTAEFAPGYDSHEFNIIVKSNFTQEESIVLSLRNHTGQTIGYTIIKNEETIPITNYVDESYILIEDQDRIQLMLNCYVDNNFNDNESYPWYNHNVTIINNTPRNIISNNAIYSMSQIKVAELALLIGTTLQNIRNVYRYGSIIYGTGNANSDEDYIVVVDSYPKPYENFLKDNVNIQIYTATEFSKRLYRNEFPFIETLFYKDEFVIQREININPPLINASIKDSAITQAYQDFDRAKKNIMSLQKDKYFVKKNLFHAFRKLKFALILITEGSISDFTAANMYYKMVFDANFESADDIEQVFRSPFNDLVNQVRTIK